MKEAHQGTGTERAVRIVLALLVAGAGLVSLLIGNVPLDEGATWLGQSALLTTVGFFLLALSLGVLFGGRMSRKIAISVDVLTIIGSIVAMTLQLSAAMNFINESHDRFEAKRLESGYRVAQWQFQQVIIEQCQANFGPRCTSLRKIDRQMAAESGFPLQTDIDEVCSHSATPATDNAEVTEWTKSGCVWLGSRKRSWTVDWSEADASNSAWRQFVGTISLAALLGFTALRTLLSSLNSKESKD